MKITVANIALALCTASTFAAAATTAVTPPALRGQAASNNNTLDLSGTGTDSSSIASTANIVEQKDGAGSDNSPPGEPPANTSVTATDGELTAAGSLRRRIASPRSVKRDISEFTEVFAGTGTGPNDRDGSIEGTAYLTYSLVPNATYDVSACLTYCDSVEGCGEDLISPFANFSQAKLYLYAQSSRISSTSSTTLFSTSFSARSRT